MRNKKLISRVLVFMLAIILMFTFIPPNLIASALGGVGGGQSGNGTGGGGVGNNDSLLNQDVGLRFSLVTLKNGKRTVVETKYSGKYFIDVWCNNSAYCKLNLDDMYRVVTDDTRYITESGTGATYSTIIKGKSGGISNTVNTWLKAKYGESNVEGEFNLGSVLFDGTSDGAAIFNEWGTTGNYKFSVYGTKFYTWAMSKSNVKINGEDIPNMEAFIKCFYGTKLKDLNLKQTFLTVEPIIYYADTVNTKDEYGGWNTTGTKSVATAYGYINRQQSFGRDPGFATAIHSRLAKVLNGFCFGNSPQDDVRAQLLNVLGLRSPSPSDFYSIDYHYFYFSDYLDYVGLGIQAFWLDDIIDGGLPIDTYNIIDKPKNTPDNAEKPSEDNDTTGDKTIIKMYCDLYKDPTTGYYTQIVDRVQYAQKKVSDKVTITNEEPINGYKVSAWYTSKTAYKDLPKGSSMFATTNIDTTDIKNGNVYLSSLGGKQLRVNNYTAATTATTKYTDSGGKSYYAGLSSPHGMNGKGSKASYTSKDAKPYTNYKRLAVKGKSKYSGGNQYNYPVNKGDDATYVELGDANTIVILYTRERIHISTDDLTVIKDDDERKSNTGELSIVKLYGIIDPNTYKITADPSKSPVVVSGVTRNVNIKSETGYNFAEWIYLTGGAGTSITAEKMGSPYLNTYKFDGTADQAYRLDGFVDGFKNNTSLEKYFRFNNKLPAIYTITGSNGLTSNVTPGRYSYGSRSGIGNKTYNSTIYFGGTGSLADGNVDGSDTNDVLYLLFLKTDQLTYASDDLVIPESYLTRYDNYKHNPMTVTGSISGNTRDEYLQAHKFKYLLPVMANGLEYKELNPLFIPHIKKPTGLYFFALFPKKIKGIFEIVVIKRFTDSLIDII